MNKKDITPRNKEGQAHGYWEYYWDDGQIYYKGYWSDGKRVGYWEGYWSTGNIWYKGYYDNEWRVGYWERYSDKEIQIYI